MKLLLTLLSLMYLPWVHADDYALYDGPKSVGCQAYNHAAKIPWNRLGGDWKDALGVPYGNTPVSTVNTIYGMQNAKISFDVTRILKTEAFALRADPKKRAVKFYSRESGLGPVLEVKLADGSTVKLPATADSIVSGARTDQPKWCILWGSYGEQTSLNTANMIVMQFGKVPANAVSGRIVMTIVQSYGNASVGLYELMVPRRDQPVTTGFSEDYPNDIGIAKDPRVLYFEDWEDLGGLPLIPLRTSPSNSWWARADFYKPNGSWKYNWTTDSFRFPNHWSGVSWKEDDGFLGSGVNVLFKSEYLGGTTSPTVSIKNKLGREAEELYVRYYVKFDSGFRSPPNCDGGKLPGFAGNRGTRYCNQNGDTPDGYCGWSLRMHFALNCDAKNPVGGKLNIGVYAYVPEKLEPYGALYSSTQNGAHGNITLNEWHCIEQHVKINTPGVHDGVIQTWIDGKLGVDIHNAIMRYRLDALHPEYVGKGINGIVDLWGTLHFGGKNSLGGRTFLAGYDGNVMTDQFVVATQRIGCANVAGSTAAAASAH